MKPILSFSTARLLTLGLILLLSACSATKMYVSRGDKFAKAGLWDDAVYNYKMALTNDLTNIKARQGLKSTGQKMLDQQINKFSRAHMDQNYREAVYAFLEAQKIVKEISTFRVELSIPSVYQDDFEEDKKEFLNRLYNEAQQLLRKKSYSEAESKFQEIVTIQPDFKDAAKMKNRALLIKTYEDARADYDNQNFRRAYEGFKAAAQIDRNYQDVQLLMTDSKEKATLTIAFAPFQASRIDRQEADAVLARIVSSLSQSGNEFIALIDRSQSDRVFQEQNIGFDTKDYSKMADLTGAKTILVGKVIGITASRKQPRGVDRTGFEAYQEKVWSKELKQEVLRTSYRKVMYTEYSASIALNFQLQWQLVNAETGKILRSGLVNENAVDEITYATYGGNTRSLYPGVWRNQNMNDPRDRVLTNQYRQLQSMLNGRQTLKDESLLLQELEETVSHNVADQILEYERTRP